MKLEIYTDGAYSPLKDRGGIGIVFLLDGEKIFEYNKYYDHCTNNQMELGAVLVALRLIKQKYDSITLYSDSKYVVGTINNNWKIKKNKRLWEEIYKELRKRQMIKFEHIRGHQGNEWNEYVDKLAVQATQML